jgi:hypothetical protein
VATIISGCDKFEAPIKNTDVEYPDFDYTAAYFPIQYPIRTIDLAEDALFDNTIDLAHQFSIGVSMGGVYENKSTRKVSFRFASDLVDTNAIFVTRYNDTLTGTKEPLIMPASYFNLILPGGDSSFTIPSGSLSGTIKVQLTDDFFNDSLAYTNRYYIPLQITGVTNLDSVLTGLPVVTNPVKINEAHWTPSALPRDYVFFMVKYINPYHGDYLVRGADYATYDTIRNGITGDTLVYAAFDVEDDKVVKGKTMAMDKIWLNYFANPNDNDGNVLNLTINSSNDSIDITGTMKASYTFVSGKGEFIPVDESTESFGGKYRRALYLQYDYVYTTATQIERHTVYDTLMLRNTGTVVEYFKAVFK